MGLLLVVAEDTWHSEKVSCNIEMWVSVVIEMTRDFLLDKVNYLSDGQEDTTRVWFSVFQKHIVIVCDLTTF